MNTNYALSMLYVCFIYGVSMLYPPSVFLVKTAQTAIFILFGKIRYARKK